VVETASRKRRYEQERTSSFGWREYRRLRAWQLYQAGWKQKDMAKALGVTEGAVSQWMKKAKAGGVNALQHQPPPDSKDNKS
jgi:transposase